MNMIKKANKLFKSVYFSNFIFVFGSILLLFDFPLTSRMTVFQGLIFEIFLLCFAVLGLYLVCKEGKWDKKKN